MKKWIALVSVLLAGVLMSSCFAWGVNLDGADIAREVASGINEYKSNEREAEGQAIAQLALETPEDAIEVFIEGIREGDFYWSLLACATDEMADGYDFEAQVERQQAFMPATGFAPEGSDLYDAINQITQEEYIATQTKLFCYSFFSTEDMGQVLQMNSEQQAQAFAELVDPDQLETLGIVRIDAPMPELLYSTANVENFDARAEIYGADELTERVVLYDLNGTLYMGGFQIMRYGSDWKIVGLSSVLAGQNVYGTVAPVTEAEYRSIIQ